MYDLRDGEVSTSTADKTPKFKKWVIMAMDFTKWAKEDAISRYLTCVRNNIAPMKVNSTTNP